MMYTVRVGGEDRKVTSLPALAAMARDGIVPDDAAAYDHDLGAWVTVAEAIAAPATAAAPIGGGPDAASSAPALFLVLVFGSVVAAMLDRGDAVVLGVFSVFMVLASSIWVLSDATRYGLDFLGGSKLDGLTATDRQPPSVWFFECLFFWVLAFPVYAAKRRRLISAAAQERATVAARKKRVG